MLALKLGLFPKNKAASISYSEEAQAIFDAMDTQLSSHNKQVVNDAIALVTTWNEADIIYLPRYFDSQSSLLNWKNPGTFDLTPNNFGAYAAWDGRAGNGATTYFATGWIPSVNGVKYQRDNSCQHIWLKTNMDEATGHGCNGAGTQNSWIFPRSANVFAGRINQDAASSLANTDSSGWTGIERTASNAINFIREGVSLGTATTVSTLRPTVEDYIGGRNNNTALANSSGNTVWGYARGSSLLSQAELKAMTDYLVANLIP